MRSRIVDPAPKICVGIKVASEKADRLEKILLAEGAKLIIAEDNCGSQQVGYLCGFRGFQKSDKEIPAECEMLIFSGFDNKTLNRTVKKMREDGCAVELKAVATQYNQSWTINALATELSKEHEAMKEYERKKAGMSNDKAEI